MDPKEKDKKSQSARAKSVSKDLRVRKEQTSKVKGGMATFGPEY